jgi:hypothetical protein
MTNCISKTLNFPAIKNRKVEAAFDGGSITSDGGSLLLRQVEQRTKLLEKIASIIPDIRDQEKITHKISTMLVWHCAWI